MDEKFIRQIPKYIEKKIRATDKKSCPAQKGLLLRLSYDDKERACQNHGGGKKQEQERTALKASRRSRRIVGSVSRAGYGIRIHGRIPRRLV